MSQHHEGISKRVHQLSSDDFASFPLVAGIDGVSIIVLSVILVFSVAARPRVRVMYRGGPIIDRVSKSMGKVYLFHPDTITSADDIAGDPVNLIIDEVDDAITVEATVLYTTIGG